MTPHLWSEGRRGHALAIGISILAFAAAWLGVLQPTLDWFHDRQALMMEQGAILQHLQNSAQQLPELKDAIARKPDRMDPAQTGMLPQGSDGASSALLLQQVESLATANGGRLLSVETPPAESVETWRKTSLRISLKAKESDVMTFLKNIEAHNPRIFADSIELHCEDRQARQSDCGILATMHLYAFRTADKEHGL